MATRRPLHTKSTASMYVSDSAASDSRPVKKGRFVGAAESHVNSKSTAITSTNASTKPTATKPTTTSITASTAVSTRPVAYEMSPPAPISVSQDHQQPHLYQQQQQHQQQQQQSKLSRGHLALKALGVSAPPSYNSGNKRPHSHQPLVSSSFVDDTESIRTATLTRVGHSKAPHTHNTIDHTDESNVRPPAPSLLNTNDALNIALDTVRGPNNGRDLYLKLKAAHFQRVQSSSATAAGESTTTTTIITTTSPTYTTDTTDDV